MSEAHQARLLLALIQERWAEFDSLAAGEPVDPVDFLRLCNRSDVPTFVLATAETGKRLETLGEPTVRALTTIRDKVRRDNLLLIAHAEQALDTLLAVGVTPVALKGLDLLHRLYERFDLRTIDDIDLLIREEQLRTATDALVAAGWRLPPEPKREHYVRSSHHLPVRSPGEIGVELEIHWNLAQERRFQVDAGGLFERALPLSIVGREVLRLEPHDYVAHLLLHHFTHYFDRRLKWAVDLHRVTREPGFSWTRVADRTREWGAEAASSMALAHLAKLVPDWIPETVLRALPVRRWRRLATRPIASPHPLDLFRWTGRREVRIYLAAVLLERPTLLPGWILHRMRRDRRQGTNPLDNGRTRPNGSD